MRTLETAHGKLALPAFLPDATKGVVRTVDGRDLASVGVEALCVNTWHLSQEPGARAIEKLGGIHRFMGFDGPVLSDSGGFQILSLIESGQVEGSATNKGLRWKKKGSAHSKSDHSDLLTPEKCIQWQARLGADLQVCLDHCTRPDAPRDEQLASVDHTIRWALACKEERDRVAQQSGRAPPLLAVVQGGEDRELRKRCAEALFEIGFDGYAFGGWPVRTDGGLVDGVALVAELAPKDAPLWGLGIGKPENVVAAARMGYSLFDCVLPTRDARHGRVYVRTGLPPAPSNDPRWWDYVYLDDEKHAVADEPLEAGCDCPACATGTRAYLHHLRIVEDPLGLRLATLHNLSFFMKLMRELREFREA
jgi:queuine tRNA-ribosyltransferase